MKKEGRHSYIIENIGRLGHRRQKGSQMHVLVFLCEGSQNEKEAWKTIIDTVSNSSRKALFSLAGSDAISADSERRVSWSLGA